MSLTKTNHLLVLNCVAERWNSRTELVCSHNCITFMRWRISRYYRPAMMCLWNIYIEEWITSWFASRHFATGQKPRDPAVHFPLLYGVFTSAVFAQLQTSSSSSRTPLSRALRARSPSSGGRRWSAWRKNTDAARHIVHVVTLTQFSNCPQLNRSGSSSFLLGWKQKVYRQHFWRLGLWQDLILRLSTHSWRTYWNNVVDVMLKRTEDILTLKRNYAVRPFDCWRSKRGRKAAS
jgi:hypothetical protein